MTTKELLYTAEEFFEFVQRPENVSRSFELHQGVIVEMPSAELLHGWIAMMFAQSVTRYLDQHPIGFVFGDSNDLILAPDVVYKPDAFFIVKERLSSIPRYFRGAPDLAVEVISPSNSDAEMLGKVEDYIRYGSRMVLLMYPERKTVRVCRPQPDGTINVRALTADDNLDGEDVLPGFRVLVRTLFPALPVEAE